MTRLCVRLAPALLAAGFAPAWADDALPPQEACAGAVIPALTPVSIEILAPVGSKVSKSGDTFPIRLAAPIVIAGQQAVPAGAMGLGEVVHAKKSGGMGAAGELVLAARYLEIGGRRLALRSFNLTANGKSHIGAVDGLAIASAASPLPVAVLGFFVVGGQVTVPQGTIAQAKTREDFAVPASSGAAPEGAPADSSSTGEAKE